MVIGNAIALDCNAKGIIHVKLLAKQGVESVCLQVLLAAIFSCLVQSALGAPSLSLGAVNASSGETVQVPITFSNDGSSAAIQFDIQYDSTQVTSGDPVAGTGLGTHSLVSTLIAPGIRRIVITPPSDNSLLSSGEVLTLPITVQSSASANSRLLTVTKVIMSGTTAGNIIPGTIGSGLIGDLANTTADQDSDGMPDSWEIKYGFNPFNSADATADANGDGLTNLQEYQQGNDPLQTLTIPSRLYASIHASSTTNDISQVVAIEPMNGSEIASIPMSSDPEGLAAHPDGSTVYAALGTDLSVIDVQSNTEVDHLTDVAGTDSTVSLLEAIAMAPDGKTLYMAYRKMPTATLEVKVFDTTTPANPTVATAIEDPAFDGCYGPLGLAVSPNSGTLYLACRPTTSGDPDRFYMVNTATHAVTQTTTFTRDQTNSGFLNAISVSPDGSRVYLARDDSSGATIEVFDGASGTHVTSIPLPTNALPKRGVVSPDGGTLYVVDQRLGTHVIDTATNTLVTTLSNTNSRGFDIISDPSGDHLYTSLLANIFVLDSATNAWSSTITGDFGSAYQLTYTPGQ